MHTNEKIVYECLKELGASPILKGYHYASCAIQGILSGKFDITNKQMMYIYNEIAKEFNTTASRVERAIRHMIEVMFANSPIEAIYKYFGNTISYDKGKVTNGQFIMSVVEYIKVHTDERYL